VSDLVVSEAYFALRYHYGVPGDPRNSALDALFESGDVAPTGCAPEVLATPGLAAAKPSFVDRMIRCGYTRELDQVFTFEKAARKLARTRAF